MAQKLHTQFTNYELVDPQAASALYYSSWCQDTHQVPESSTYLVYDGSFAPVHWGHLDILLFAIKHIQSTGLHSSGSKIILLITCNHPCHLKRKIGTKEATLDASPEHRYSMLKEAFNSLRWKSEMASLGIDLTIDYFEECSHLPVKTNCLQSICRGIAKSGHQVDRVWFVVGDDALWRLKYQLCLGVRVLVAFRSGAASLPEMTKAIPSSLLQPPHYHPITPTLHTLSSTAIRKYLHSTESPDPEALNKLVGISEISTYILQKGLFRKLPHIIGISGTSGAGKTTLARNISASLAQNQITSAIVQTDDYLKDVGLLEPILDLPRWDGTSYYANWDLPTSVEWAKFFQEVLSKVRARPGVLILEGAHLITNEAARELCDHIYYLDGDLLLLKERRIARKKNKTALDMSSFHRYWEQYLVPFALQNRALAQSLPKVTLLPYEHNHLPGILQSLLPAPLQTSPLK
eukprot:TRINITY_DN13661_c0_g1_i1.p1 TRINITY_DN13661_c0_g1~~TRINITY_DN13661_c0_g1_i1.p1  ORF type:complete len:499 (-),score=101.57 TRINITY_DN13661_c0_g1_i1:12-1400(-)